MSDNNDRMAVHVKGVHIPFIDMLNLCFTAWLALAISGAMVGILGAFLAFALAAFGLAFWK
jgi:hypothetical protein